MKDQVRKTSSMWFLCVNTMLLIEKQWLCKVTEFLCHHNCQNEFPKSMCFYSISKLLLSKCLLFCFKFHRDHPNSNRDMDVLFCCFVSDMRIKRKLQLQEKDNIQLKQQKQSICFPDYVQNKTPQNVFCTPSETKCPVNESSQHRLFCTSLSIAM